MRLPALARFRPLVAAASLLVTAGLATTAVAASAPPPPTPTDCSPRLLILSAMPSEIGPLLDATTVTDTVKYNGRTFYVGRLAGNKVILALTHIGLQNAHQATTAAYRLFGCAISGVVFSGVSGGDSNIGDVTVPSRWRFKSGGSWHATDPAMLQVATAASKRVKLLQRNPVGDPACACIDPTLIKTVKVKEPPRVLIGGDGVSSDPFAGRTLPCFADGGNIFGCDPCKAQAHDPQDVPRFVNGIRPFIPGFFFDYFKNPTPADSPYAAEDMETAMAAKVAAQHHTPFIAFRALSDGDGDKLHLPGFPFQFFYYQELAAQNAATTALAFLRAWSQR
jgi:nucleoside phosphorylase